MCDEIRYLQYDEDTKMILGFLVPRDNIPSNTYKVTLDFLHNVNKLGHTHVKLEGDEVVSYKKELPIDAAFVGKTREFNYRKVSDPMFMEWQYALATGDPAADEYKTRWVEAVQLIKYNNPKG